MSAEQLAGRIALITGAAGMIGAATARELAARGAVIVAVDRPGAAWARKASGRTLPPASPTSPRM